MNANNSAPNRADVYVCVRFKFLRGRKGLWVPVQADLLPFLQFLAFRTGLLHHSWIGRPSIGPCQRYNPYRLTDYTHAECEARVWMNSRIASSLLSSSLSMPTSSICECALSRCHVLHDINRKAQFQGSPSVTFLAHAHAMSFLGYASV